MPRKNALPQAKSSMVTGSLGITQSSGLDRHAVYARQRVDEFRNDDKLNIPESKIMRKKTYDLSSLATVAPENASNKTIAWTVSGNDGVTLGEDGKTLTVSDTAAGTVTLTATITNGTLNEDGTTEVDYTKPFALTIVPYQPTISFNAGTGPGGSGHQEHARAGSRGKWQDQRAHRTESLRLDV